MPIIVSKHDNLLIRPTSDSTNSGKSKNTRQVFGSFSKGYQPIRNDTNKRRVSATRTSKSQLFSEEDKVKGLP